jgi:hypothetical protein
VRQRLKLIFFAALSAALTVAGLSIAAGGGSSDTGQASAGKERDVHFGFGPPPGEKRFDSDVADVLRQIHEAVEQKGPEIAEPIIQKAEDAGDITSAQADKLRALFKAEADEKGPGHGARFAFRDRDVVAVLQDVFDAKAKAAPDIAEPIIQKALDDKKITSAQADDIRSHLKNAPPFGRGFPGHGHGPGFGPGGPGFGPGGPPGPPGFKNFDRDVATVFGDIHQAVEKKAPEIAEPIIKKAEDSGDITSDQADKLRTAAQQIADGKRPDAARSLLRDSDVRKVVQDVFKAAAEQAPEIGEPIIRKALDDKKITSAQVDDIRAKLKNLPDFSGGPPPFGRPGGVFKGRHFGGPGRFERPGRAPGALPGGPPGVPAPGGEPAVPARPA